MIIFQVTIKVKSKHIGGAFSKNNKCKSPTFQQENFPRCIWKDSKPHINPTAIQLSIYIPTFPGILYEVISDSSSWPFRKERENMEMYFRVKTAQGLLEFKCKNKVHKQKWVHGIQNLLQRRSRFEEAENSLRMLNINKII